MTIDPERLIQLRAEAQALEKTRAEQREMLEKGMLDPDRYSRMATEVDRKRLVILHKLKAAIGGTDARIDSVLDGEIDGTADKAEATKQLRKVAEEKGLGTKILEAIDKNRGTIITWAIDIALAIGKRVI
jgi:hypothetical protein